MKTFETIEELYEATKDHQLTAQQVINRRAFIDNDWQDFEVSEELEIQFSSDIAQLCEGQGNTKNKVFRALRTSRPQHWGLTRFFISKKPDNSFVWSYCAGQDYSAEIKQIRKYLAR